MKSILVKRSNANKLAFPQIDGLDIKRAITVKEAINKQSKTQFDCIIIEDAHEDDINTVAGLLGTTNLNSNTLLLFLTEPALVIEEAIIKNIRTIVGNDRQVVIIDKYAEGNEYKAIIDEATVLFSNMNAPMVEETVPEQSKHEDLDIAGDIRFDTYKVDNTIVMQLQSQLRSVQEELRLATEFIDRISNNPEISELSFGGANAERLQEENDELKAEIERLKEVRDSLTTYEYRISELVSALQAEQYSTGIWRGLTDKIFEYTKLMQRENQLYKQTADQADDKVKRVQGEMNDHIQAEFTLKNQNMQLTETVSRLQEENQELQIDLNTAIETGKNLKEKIDELDAIITRLNDEKKSLASDLAEAASEAARLQTYDIEQLRQRASDGGSVQEILEERLRTFKEELRNMDEKNKQLNKEINTAQRTIEGLRNEKRVLESMLDGENYGSRGITWIRPVQARLMVFIGHGGQGCSSVSTGTARRLFEAGKSVVVIDCDFRAPKLHALFGVNPVIEQTRFSKLTTDKKTSLGKLLVVGAGIYSEIKEEMIIPVAEKGSARLDLISGLVSVSSTSEISGLDLNALCVELATIYEYIIIDLGRSEGIGGIARQQSAIMLNANRRFIVTSNNMECVKSLVARLVQAKIDIDTTEIIFNMVMDKQDKALDVITKRVKKVYNIEFDKRMAGKTCLLPPAHPVIKQIVYTELGEH